jgi:hypothetical protein
MKAKKNYHKNYVDRKVRIKKLIYLVIILIMFGIVLYDSFINGLPFHYILFFFIGSFMSRLLKKSQKVKWRETDNKFVEERNIIGIIIVAIVIILRIFLFPGILTQLNVIFISDAFFLISTGWFSGRIKLLNDKLEEKAFSGFVGN